MTEIEQQQRKDAIAPEDLRLVYPVLRYFTYEHLPTHLAEISRPFCLLAQETAKRWERNNNEVSYSETVKALDRLLEAKDAAVRAAVKP